MKTITEMPSLVNIRQLKQGFFQREIKLRREHYKMIPIYFVAL